MAVVRAGQRGVEGMEIIAVVIRIVVKERDRDRLEIGLLLAVDPEVRVRVECQRQARLALRLPRLIDRMERHPRHTGGGQIFIVIVTIECDPVLDREGLTVNPAGHVHFENRFGDQIEFINVDLDDRTGDLRLLIGEGPAGAPQPGGEDDLGCRRVPFSRLVGHGDPVPDRLRREEDRGGEFLDVARPVADLFVEIADLRPPDLQFADVHREDRGIEVIRRHPLGRVGVEGGVVGVLDRIPVGVGRLVIEPNPAGIEEALLFIAHPVRLGRGDLLREEGVVRVGSRVRD